MNWMLEFKYIYGQHHFKHIQVDNLKRCSDVTSGRTHTPTACDWPCYNTNNLILPKREMWPFTMHYPEIFCTGLQPLLTFQFKIKNLILNIISSIRHQSCDSSISRSASKPTNQIAWDLSLYSNLWPSFQEL